MLADREGSEHDVSCASIEPSSQSLVDLATIRAPDSARAPSSACLSMLGLPALDGTPAETTQMSRTRRGVRERETQIIMVELLACSSGVSTES